MLLRWSAQTAPRRKRAAVRGPRGSRFDAAQWAKREPGGSVRLEGCIQDGSLGYCATERVACAATAPLNVSHPGKRNTLSLQHNSNTTSEDFSLDLPDRSDCLELTALQPILQMFTLGPLSRAGNVLTVPYPQKCSDSVLTAF